MRGFVALCVALWVRESAAMPTAPVKPQQDRKTAPTYLFVDRGVIADRPEGTEALPGPVTKESKNPLLVEDKVWDVRWDNTYITARYDRAMKKTRLWWNSQLTCKGDGTTTISPKDQCGHPTWHSTKAFDGYWPQQDSLKGGLLYAEADVSGVDFTKPDLPIIPGMAYDTKQKKNVVFSNTSNILLQAYADPNRGVIFDTHDANASRRYKAFGSFWSDGQWGKQRGDCVRPKHAKDGDIWPACTNIGVSYSSDGIHFDHATDETAFQPGNQPGTRDIGQDDGALDLAIWDEDLDEYWGLVRIDVEGFSMGGHKNDPCSDHNGTVVVDPTKCSNGRRTGRFTTKDFVHFTHAVQVFNGSADYEIYTVQPFRLPSYRKGYYLATGMFFEAHEVQEVVECELLQSTDHGQSWEQVAPRRPFIPRGSAVIRPDGSTDPQGNAFDSHTIYTAWTGDQLPFLDPQNESITRFYYSGGDGPHSGQRDDSIGLAYATTHAWAGLRLPAAEEPTILITEVLQTAMVHHTLWLLVDVPSGGSVDVSLATNTGEPPSDIFASVGTIGSTAGLQRIELSVASLLCRPKVETTKTSRTVRLRFSTVGVQTLYSFGFE